MNIDVQDILEVHGIAYQPPPHPNVTKQWLGVECPSCGDDQYHGGIHSQSGAFSCFKCGFSTDLVGFIAQTLGTSRTLVETTLKSARPIPLIGLKEELRRRLGAPTPTLGAKEPSVSPLFHPPPLAKPIRELTGYELLHRFLKKRRYSAKYATSRMAMACEAGPYAHRFIIPILDADSVVVGWQGRDMTDTAKNKYAFPKGFDASHYLYGIDRFTGDWAVLVEGVFDQWRVSQAGFPALCTFGSHVCPPQVNILYEMGVKYLTFLYDNDAYDNAMSESMGLAGLFDSRVVNLPPGLDPDKMYDKKELKAVIR